MARTLTPRDCYALMNELVSQATGQKTLSVVDTSTFVSAGEQVLQTGTENVLNSLSLVLGRTLMAVRPYKAKMMILNALNSGAYSNRVRKISLYARDNQASGDYNTQNFTNLATGYTNGQNEQGGVAQSTKSMWEQNQPVALEMNFAGSDVWETSTTVYEDQLKIAFRSEGEFADFVAGVLTEKGNDIESTKEAFNRMTLLNHMAGVYDLTASMEGSAVNLTAEYNAKFGTNYSTQDLQTIYLDSFLKFFVARIKNDSDFMTERSKRFHWSPAKTIGGASYTLLRHTPKDKQKCMLYNPLFVDAKAQVLPEIFNPSYLDINNFEGVNYWQALDKRAGIDVTPAIPDVTGVGGQTAGANVKLNYVVGCLFDEDAVMTDYQLEASNTTPLEARKRYRNIWWTFRKNAINDFTENFILYYMAD